MSHLNKVILLCKELSLLNTPGKIICGSSAPGSSKLNIEITDGISVHSVNYCGSLLEARL